jgi:glutamate 5-kinase
MIAVVKIGTSSITRESGELDDGAMVKLCGEIAGAIGAGHQIVLVSSGAIAAGLPASRLAQRPRDIGTLQAIAAIGQPRLMARFGELFAAHDLVAGQVLLTPYDFGHRAQYLHARSTLARLLELRVVPVVNENDTIADDEIRYGDNDRLAALVSHLVGATLLVLLTDTSGVFTADPRLDTGASLIEEIVEVDAALEAVAGGRGTERGSGGMASKLAAAKIAAWSGVRTVIADAREADVVIRAIDDRSVGTVIHPRGQRLSSRKLWIAFARAAAGRVAVDDGARRALVEGNRSLLPAGVRDVVGAFDVEDAVEVVDATGRVFAKGLAGMDAATLRSVAGRRTDELGDGVAHEVIHRDDMVILPS